MLELDNGDDGEKRRNGKSKGAGIDICKTRLLLRTGWRCGSGSGDVRAMIDRWACGMKGAKPR